ncbi:hypothetical protein BN1723_013448 [Verticillium longisporum]|uniref:Copper amine oxidase catalytic domain-containing protein n=1 Tax=Verticillium longisporum TaxID=100787 RepID=A0A0G4LSB8_VERLO|nr:hypothetical protein BN1723_013448 [Verticillium longisporum]
MEPDRNAASAEKALQRLGYTSELPRNLSMMSILGMSFAIMAVPFGLSTTMYITLTTGQSVSVLWGWVLVSLISCCIAASLAEICAVYPTAGGVYYWSAMLSTPEWAPIVSFIDGWLTLVGNWTVTLSINFSGAQLVLSAISIFDEDFVPNEWQTVLAFWAVMLVRATGIMSTAPIDIGDTVPYGTIVAPGTLAPYHQHLFCLRIDPAIGGHANSLVVEESHAMAFEEEDASGEDCNPFGVGYTTTSQVIEKETGLDLDFHTNRVFKMVNEAKRNTITGTPIGFKLLPCYSQLLLAHPKSYHARRSEQAHDAVARRRRDRFVDRGEAS